MSFYIARATVCNKMSKKFRTLSVVPMVWSCDRMFPPGIVYVGGRCRSLLLSNRSLKRLIWLVFVICVSYVINNCSLLLFCINDYCCYTSE